VHQFAAKIEDKYQALDILLEREKLRLSAAEKKEKD
jgi:hypothetical protein